MTETDFDQIKQVIEMAQRLHSSLHAKLLEKGIAPIDALIASTYATAELASHLHGNPVSGVEWMRDALDQIERNALAGQVRH